MPLWGSIDRANNAPKFTAEMLGIGSGKTNMAANNTSLFNNVSVGAVYGGQVVGVFGVSPAEMANTTSSESKAVSAPGWNLRKEGTGGIKSVVSSNGTGYANTDLLKVSGGTVNAAGSVTTNSTGGITAFSITNPGYGFANVSAATVAVTNSSGGASAGSGLVAALTLGGRAGRYTYECLVEHSGLTGDASDDTYLPE